jgi:outer membrane protein TolC
MKDEAQGTGEKIQVASSLAPRAALLTPQDSQPPSPPRADEPLTLSLQQAVSLALEKNPRLRQAAARVEAARAGADIAFAPFLPEAGTGFRYSGFNIPVLPGGSFVPASLTGGANSFSLAEAGVQWIVSDFGRTAGRYGQAVTQTRIEKLSLERARQTIAFEAARAYFQSLLAQATLRVREQSLRQAEKVLADTRARLVGGVVDREAVLRAEVEVSQAREELVGARQQVADAAATLNLTLGRPTLLPVRVQDVSRHPALAQSIEEALQQAVGKRPEVDIARAAVAEAAYGEEAARADLLPKVFVRGTVIRVDSTGPLEGWVAGAGVHVEQPLYGGGRRRAEIRRQQAQVAGATAALQAIVDNIGQQVNLAFQAIATHRERIVLGETAVVQTRENLRLTLVKYSNGNATPTDVVDAQTALTRAQTRYYAALYEYLEGLARLEYAQGGDQRGLVSQLMPEPAKDAEVETAPVPRIVPHLQDLGGEPGA